MCRLERVLCGEVKNTSFLMMTIFLIEEKYLMLDVIAFLECLSSSDFLKVPLLIVSPMKTTFLHSLQQFHQNLKQNSK